ncbi:MAG: hypothetical protein RR443_09655 [Anaerorhabdus sp.]|uniref:hypothetical protein n=1 Tax=Anaerorhabdus sp. TaxID=1872524 RepID=UPI002FCAC25D
MSFRLKKEESVVIIVGVLLIAVLVAGGIYKQSLDDKNKNKEFKVTAQKAGLLSLANPNFELEVNTPLDEKVETYINGSAVVLKDTKIDFTGVDITKLGHYKVIAKKGKELLEVPISIVDHTVPVISAKTEKFIFYLEANSTPQEVIDYALVSAIDNYDGDISAQVTGWPTQLPKKDEDIVYLISVKDSSGNVTEKNITVSYKTIKQAPAPTPTPVPAPKPVVPPTPEPTPVVPPTPEP